MRFASRTKIISLCIAIIMVSGAAIFIYKNSQRAQPAIQQDTSSQSSLKPAQSQPHPSSPTLTISELGVQLQFSDVDKLTYVVSNPANGNYRAVKISIKKQYLAQADCQISVFLNRASSKDTVTGSEPRKIGKYYFNLSTSPEYCGTDPNSKTNKWRASLIKALDPNEGHYSILK